MCRVTQQRWSQVIWKHWLASSLQAYAQLLFLDGANHNHDYYLARAASLRCLETCFPKETTEGQLLSAELFSLLSMCVLAACLRPTDPEQQHETGLPASPPHPSSLPHTPLLSPIIHRNWSTQIFTLKMSEYTHTHTKKAHILRHPPGKREDAGNCMDVSFDFFVWNSTRILFKKPTEESWLFYRNAY